MAHYTARVLDDRRLELPEGALRLIEPGQQVEVDVSDDVTGPGAASNDKVLTMLRDLAEMKREMPESDPSETDEIVRRGRAGEMYGE
jgi:hypothetical protein